MLLCAVVFAFPQLADVAPEIVATCVIAILFAFGPAESIANLHPLYGTALHVHHILRTWEERSMEDLSSGQRRRLALFAALSRRRDVYLLDEPAATLTPMPRSGSIERCFRACVEPDGLTSTYA